MMMRGRWAAGIKPKDFRWIIADHLAVCERPGGYGSSHRKIRRQEEILWLKANGFTRIVSIMPTEHNLHAYEEFHVPYEHLPIPKNADLKLYLPALYRSFRDAVENGERIMVHCEEVTDYLISIVGGFLLWAKLLENGPQTVTLLEKLSEQTFGNVGRTVITNVLAIEPIDRPFHIRRTSLFK